MIEVPNVVPAIVTRTYMRTIVTLVHIEFAQYSTAVRMQ
jgi:hypothetical protein